MATLWERFIIHICLIVALQRTFTPSVPVLIAQISKLCRDFLSLYKFFCLYISFSWFFLIHSLIFFSFHLFCTSTSTQDCLDYYPGDTTFSNFPHLRAVIFPVCENNPSLLLRTQNYFLHAYKKALASNLINLMSTQKSQTLYCEAVLTHHGSEGQWALLKDLR